MVVIDYTNMRNHNIVHFPLAIDVMQPVVNRQVLSPIADDFGLNCHLIAFLNFTLELNCLAVVGMHRPAVKHQ